MLTEDAVFRSDLIMAIQFEVDGIKAEEIRGITFCHID